MSPSRTVMRVLDATTVATIAAAALVAVWPAHIAAPSTKARVTPVSVLAPPISTLAGNDDANAVVAANILSGSRQKPAARYVSPETMAAAEFVLPAAFAAPTSRMRDSAASGANATVNDDAVPAVFGIVSVNGTWRALLRLSGSDVSPRLMREGDERGGYRIVSISSEKVVVANSRGQQTLRLSRLPPADAAARRP